MIVSIRLIPRSPRSAITGLRGEALVIRLKAAPADGAANEALAQFLATTFGRPRGDITLVGGERSRHKRVRIEGLTEADFLARLSAILNQLPAE